MAVQPQMASGVRQPVIDLERYDTIGKQAALPVWTNVSSTNQTPRRNIGELEIRKYDIQHSFAPMKNSGAAESKGRRFLRKAVNITCGVLYGFVAFAFTEMVRQIRGANKELKAIRADKTTLETLIKTATGEDKANFQAQLRIVEKTENIFKRHRTNSIIKLTLAAATAVFGTIGLGSLCGGAIGGMAFAGAMGLATAGTAAWNGMRSNNGAADDAQDGRDILEAIQEYNAPPLPA